MLFVFGSKLKMEKAKPKAKAIELVNGRREEAKKASKMSMVNGMQQYYIIVLAFMVFETCCNVFTRLVKPVTFFKFFLPFQRFYIYN